MNRTSKLLFFILTINVLTGFPLLADDRLPNKKEQINKINSPDQIEYYDDVHWIQYVHESVSESVYESAKWFDDFFIDDDSRRGTPKTNARIRLGWKPKSRDWDTTEIKFRIRVSLPHFENEVDLILSDDTDIEQRNLPLETANSRINTNEESFAAAVRIIHRQKENSFTDSRIGISGGDIFVRARHKRKFVWSEKHGFRLEPSTYYFLKDGIGARFLVEYDYQLNEQQQFRINYSIRGSESYKGIRWKHGFYHLTQINEKSASVLAVQVEGERNGEEGFFIDKYTLSYRYRFNAVRKWLYFEIEPFLEWPEDEHYTTTPGIALRVEGYFYKG